MISRADATFAVRQGLAAAATVPLVPGRTVGLEAGNIAGQRMQHQDFQAVLREAGTASSAVVEAGTSWTVRRADAISLESVDWPGHVLVAPSGGGTVTVARRDGSAGFDARATFAPVAGVSGQGTTPCRCGPTGPSCCATPVSCSTPSRRTAAPSAEPTPPSPCAWASPRRPGEELTGTSVVFSLAGATARGAASTRESA